MSPSATPTRPRVIGHRGAAALAPENTMESFRRAADAGAAGIELDVRATRDGILVVHHDETLDRLTNARGPLAHFDAAALRREVRVCEAHAIPHLDEVIELARLRNLLLYVELKEGATAPAAAELLLRHLAPEQFVVGSFDHNAVARLRASHPAVRTLVIFEGAPCEPAAMVRAAGAAIASVAIATTTPELAAALAAARIPLWCWTVNTREQLARALDAHAEAIVTDDPARLSAWLDEPG